MENEIRRTVPDFAYEQGLNKRARIGGVLRGARIEKGARIGGVNIFRAGEPVVKVAPTRTTRTE